MVIQAQYLNKLLQSGDSSLITVNNLTDDFFSDYKDEFNFIRNHLQRYGRIPDKETFLSIFPNFDLFDVNETSKYLLDALYEDRNKRYLVKSFNAIRDAINNNDIDKALKIQKETNEKLAVAKHIEAVDIFQDRDRYDAYLERMTDFGKYYVTTGFKELDDVIGGWDRREEYATIIARPGRSKSWTLLKTALAAAEKGLNVGLFSGEMTKNKVGYRLDTLLSHISNTRLNHGESSIQVEYQKFIEEVGQNLKGSIKILTPAMVGSSVGVGVLRAFVEKYKLDMLCIDQHSLLEDDRGARNPVDRAANISKDIKLLQTLTQIPIITVSQQNREKPDEKEGADTRNVAQSDRIGQDSTIVIALDKKDDIITLNLIKSRDGGDGRHLKYLVNLDKGFFNFIADEEDATGGAKCQELKDEFEYNNDFYSEEPF